MKPSELQESNRIDVILRLILCLKSGLKPDFQASLAQFYLRLLKTVQSSQSSYPIASLKQ